MPRDPLPLSVLLALGLTGCNSCRPGVCLSIAQDPEVEDVSHPCLSFVPDPPPEEEVESEEAPEPRAGPCLSIAPLHLDLDHQRVCLSEEQDLEGEPDAPPCLSEEPEPALEPCLSVRPVPAPPSEEEAAGDGDAALDADDERLALLERLGEALPADVRRRL
jgi:hypothetical protein